MRTVRILAVDDHEMTTLGYKFILEDTEFDGFKVQMDTAKSYEESVKKIEEAAKGIPYDILLLDIQLSNPTEGPAKTGEDLGIRARKVSPGSKIVFMSSFSDNYRINSIMQTVDPEGYMVKTEIDQKSLQAMVNTVLTSPPYYTQKALVAIRKKMAQDISLDENDKKILYHLSIGTKTKDMVKYISLSLPGIENRKRQLKSLFGVEKQNDQALITASRNKGFI
ncbi:DNA-binding response regulator, NarL/FixJ family, contains REC and HTH domains [Muriicola jejuensis]|uniref:Histidine kinase n=1 Tax=Muriicola jejuensis TaxID=504488 RepID=A0A6P0UCW4_9FLAO|nr:response regulator [Muriicola jejuensis]NER11094.1 histidine kinase [Muriicola jejuensis]SMP23700.1 DNA-binding response regulator, NarL/FixJ family, contains REC and HTH domains [Muriicola jejuensis]